MVTINIVAVVDDILKLGLDRKLLPSARFLDIKEFKVETTKIINNAINNGTPAVEVTTKLLDLWSTGADTVVTYRGMTWYYDVFLEVGAILLGAGFSIPDI